MYENPGMYVTSTSVPRAASQHRQHKGLITTTAVQTQAGWLGQVLVDQQIVWEAAPESEREDALEIADEHVARVLGGLFADQRLES